MLPVRALILNRAAGTWPQGIVIDKIPSKRIHAYTESKLHPRAASSSVALGSPIFPSGCEGNLGVALESPQGR